MAVLGADYSISASLLARFAQQNEHFTRHSSFKTVGNFVGDQGTLLALVMPSIGNGPFQLVVPPFVFAQIQEQHQLQVQDSILTAGSLTLPLHKLPVWDAQLPALHHIPLTYFAQLEQHYHQYGTPALGFATAEQQETSKPATLYTQRLQQAVVALSLCLHEANSAYLITVARLLAGLGPGLTPAGDDFLVGWLGAVYALAPYFAPAQWTTFRGYAHQLAQVAAARTTTLSAAWLTHAGAGELSAAWHALLHALNRADWPVIEQCANQILATGATSGADAMGGFLVGIRQLYRWCEQKKSR